MNFNATPLWLTFKLALVTTIILGIIGLPLAYWLANSRFKGKAIIATLVSMPLVLPPSVIGFYLLLGLSPENGLGALLDDWFGLRLVFSFPGLVLASVIYSLPFFVQPVQAGFANLPPSLSEAAYTLGKSKIETLFKVLIPNIRPALLTGLILSFAHTVGEFGVVLMVGGNIPGVTRVASIAIYDEVEALNYDAANVYAGILFLIAFCILLTVHFVNRNKSPLF